MSRTVIVGDEEYIVDLMVSTPLHRERLGGERYVQVELPGAWKAVFAAPPGVDDISRLWYRELVALVRTAHRVVALRKADVGAHVSD